jgi:hypothetical protein
MKGKDDEGFKFSVEDIKFIDQIHGYFRKIQTFFLGY